MTKNIHEIEPLRAALATDELPVQSAGGGASARVTAQSVADLGAAVSPVFSRTVTLDSTQIDALDSASVELVPSPGPGKALIPISSFFGVLKLNGGCGAQSGGTINIGWGDGFTSAIDLSGISISGLSLDGLAGSTGSQTFEAAEAVDKGIFIGGIGAGSGPSLVPGAIVSSSLAAGGSGWVPGDAFILGNNTDGNPNYGIVDTVSGGAIATYHFTTNLPTYLVSAALPVVAVDPSVGIGATIDVTEIDITANPVTVSVTTFYAEVVI